MTGKHLLVKITIKTQKLKTLKDLNMSRFIPRQNDEDMGLYFYINIPIFQFDSCACYKIETQLYMDSKQIRIILCEVRRY